MYVILSMQCILKCSLAFCVKIIDVKKILRNKVCVKKCIH